MPHSFETKPNFIRGKVHCSTKLRRWRRNVKWNDFDNCYTFDAGRPYNPGGCIFRGVTNFVSSNFHSNGWSNWSNISSFGDVFSFFFLFWPNIRPCPSVVIRLKGKEMDLNGRWNWNEVNVIIQFNFQNVQICNSLLFRDGIERRPFWSCSFSKQKNYITLQHSNGFASLLTYVSFCWFFIFFAISWIRNAAQTKHEILRGLPIQLSIYYCKVQTEANRRNDVSVVCDAVTLWENNAYKRLEANTTLHFVVNVLALRCIGPFQIHF